MTDTQTMRAEFEGWADDNCIRKDMGAWDAWQAAWTRKPAAQVAGACELRGTGKCGCPTACRLNMAAMITAPMPIYTHPAPEPDATKVVSVPELTDEQIEEVIESMGWSLDPQEDSDVKQFARAIVRALAADRERT